MPLSPSKVSQNFTKAVDGLLSEFVQFRYWNLSALRNMRDFAFQRF